MIDRLEALEKSNPKEYWQIFDKLKNSEQDAVGNSIPMDEWVHYYSQLLSPRPIVAEWEALIKEQLHRMKSITYFSELDFRITLPEVTGAIKSLKKGKAVGIDNISNEMIVLSVDVMAPIYGKLFNSILNNHHYPTLWKTGIINNLY